jgi:hypothetical protein
VKPEPADMISAEPRTLSSRVSWVLVALLAAAITVAVRYRAEVAALRHHPRPVAVSLPPGTGPPTPFKPDGHAALLRDTERHGDNRLRQVFRGLEQIVVSAHLSGGRPHTGYTLTGFDCAGIAVATALA